MIYLYLFGTCFHFIYVFMIIGNKIKLSYLCIGFIIVMNTTLKRKEDNETIRSIIRA